MKVRDLYARPLESQQEAPPDYRQFYRQAAQAMEADCWFISPQWLLDHPAWWEQIKVLDDKLTVMERAGASEPEYRATLEQLMRCIQEAAAEQFDRDFNREKIQ